MYSLSPHDLRHNPAGASATTHSSTDHASLDVLTAFIPRRFDGLSPLSTPLGNDLPPPAPAMDSPCPLSAALDNEPPPPAAAKQIGGAHYQGHGIHRNGTFIRIEPWDIIEAWDLDFWEGNALKYLLRRKNGTPRPLDLQKAIHYLEKCLERAEAS